MLVALQPQAVTPAPDRPQLLVEQVLRLRADQEALVLEADKELLPKVQLEVQPELLMLLKFESLRLRYRS